MFVKVILDDILGWNGWRISDTYGIRCAANFLTPARRFFSQAKCSDHSKTARLPYRVLSDTATFWGTAIGNSGDGDDSDVSESLEATVRSEFPSRPGVSRAPSVT